MENLTTRIIKQILTLMPSSKHRHNDSEAALMQTKMETIIDEEFRKEKENQTELDYWYDK